MDHWAAIANERRTFADEVEALTPAQWEAPSLCGDWTVRQVVGHLVMPHETPRLTVLREVLRDRGNFNRAISRLGVGAATRPTGELVAAMRRHADSRFTPPGFGSIAPLTDLLVHGMDIRVPLGLPVQRTPEAFVDTLDFLVRPAVQRVFFAKRVPRLRLLATDVEWEHGMGPEVRGRAADLALSLSGRRARLDHLTGDGTADLERWVTG